MPARLLHKQSCVMRASQRRNSGAYNVHRRAGMGMSASKVSGPHSKDEAVDIARQYNRNNHTSLYYVKAA